MIPLILQGGTGEASLDIISLVLNASPVVKGVLGLLILMSVASWFVIGFEDALPRERGVAVDQVPGQLLEDGAARRDLAHQRVQRHRRRSARCSGPATPSSRSFRSGGRRTPTRRARR